MDYPMIITIQQSDEGEITIYGTPAPKKFYIEALDAFIKALAENAMSIEELQALINNIFENYTGETDGS